MNNPTQYPTSLRSRDARTFCLYSSQKDDSETWMNSASGVVEIFVPAWKRKPEATVKIEPIDDGGNAVRSGLSRLLAFALLAALFSSLVMAGTWFYVRYLMP